MCLLITGKSSEIRTTLLNTKGLIADIYDHNSDGVGAMYATAKGELRTVKMIPNSAADFADFVRRLPDDDRSLAIHARMRTHGATDLENCHPYPVVDGIAMMHNGVLSQGNKADVTKSDTWHYVNDVIKPMLAEAPRMFMNTAWMSLVEDDIGSGNRFAIMDGDGNLAVLNKHTGTMVGDLWFSNEYAWDPSLLIPGYRKYKPTTVSTYYGNLALGYAPAHREELWEALDDADVGAVSDLLADMPVTSFVVMFDDFEFAPYEYGMSSDDEQIAKMLADQDITGLAQRCRTMSGATLVAQVMTWFGDWNAKAINESGTVTDETIEAAAQLDAAIRDGAGGALDVTVEETSENYAG